MRAIIGAVVLAAASFGGAGVLAAQQARADGTSSLPTCPFWTDVTPPARSDTPWVAPLQTAPAVDFSSRLPAPGTVTGTLTGSQVNITFARVAGAQAYRVWRNGQAIAWVSDWGQTTLTAVDNAPCQNAYYSFESMSAQSGADSTLGAMSAPYQLNSSGSVVPWQTPVGRTLTMMVTSYNDGGATASGYNAQLGVCAVDPRVIPWGTYFTVPGYGTCYAADIGTWIQNDTVDVWLPGTQSNGWGVQHRTVTIIADPHGVPTPPSSSSSTTATSTTPPSGCTVQAWNAGTAYSGGAVVSYGGHKWTAKWWTQGDVPGANSQNVWTDNGVC
ncbi:MAG: hypothetical protein HOV83_24830 [Catenulispora sp.]|nr:hypothetical protein [Catenulispora sp.]